MSTVDCNDGPTEQCPRYIEPGCPYRSDDVNSPEQAVTTGTTIMCVEYEGGVILGADSRTSTGDYVANRASRKITQIHDKICVCRAGSAADTQSLSRMVSNYLGMHSVELNGLPAVNTCANLFKIMCYQNKDHLMASIIVAGWDEKKGGQVYVITLGGTKLRQPVVCTGSGSMYINALVNDGYKPGMTKAEAKQYVRHCIAHAMSCDGSSGGVIRTVCIDGKTMEEETLKGNELPYGPAGP